jgi:hypothetical protein
MSMYSSRLRQTMRSYVKNDVFWDVTSCGSCKNRRFGGSYRLLHQGARIGELGTTLAVTTNRRTLGINHFLQCHWYCSLYTQPFRRYRRLHDYFIYIQNQRNNNLEMSWNFSRKCMKLFYSYVRFELFKALTMKNAVFWDIKTQFVPHKRRSTSTLQSPAG